METFLLSHHIPHEIIEEAKLYCVSGQSL